MKLKKEAVRVKRMLSMLPVLLFLGSAGPVDAEEVKDPAVMAAPSGFEVTTIPGTPRGGEAVFLTIKGESADEYEVDFEGVKYRPYFSEEGMRSIFLPLKIEAGGEKKVVVRRYRQGLPVEEKEAVFVVRERVKKRVELKVSDEKMRDKQPLVEQQNRTVLDLLGQRSSERLWKRSFRLPLSNPVSASFAVRREGAAYSYYHKGLDFSAPAGTPVRAINRGKVIASEKGLNVYGNTLIVDHGQGVVSCYFHLSKVLKRTGDTVQQGEIIARVGSTGWATGPHLHMGVYIQGQAIDPLQWIAFTRDIYKDRDSSRLAKSVKRGK
jgi:murein DD-endopeptidase MepM/ murein hydrolase activator NlpD